MHYVYTDHILCDQCIHSAHVYLFLQCCFSVYGVCDLNSGGTSGQKSVAAGGVETSPQQNKSTSMATKCVEFKPQQWKVVSLARPDMVKAIESQARKHGVIITYPAESSYIKICGCSPQVSEIEEHFEDLKNYVIVSSKTLQWSPGLWMVMKSMKDSICLLEHDYPVAIDIKAVTSESTDGAECQTVFTAQLGENRIEICFGNFTKYSSATTIINLMVRNMDGYHLHELVETGGKEILSDLESRMKELSLCELPQVFETKPRNLPVRKLIHCVVYNWRQSDVKVARVLEEGVKHALRSSSPPYIVVAQSTAIQCPPVVLAEVITKEILSSSCSFSGAHFALFITSKEDEKALEQFFQSRRATMQFNDASKLLDKCDGNSNTHIAVLHDHLSFLSIINGDLMKQKVRVKAVLCYSVVEHNKNNCLFLYTYLHVQFILRGGTITTLSFIVHIRCRSMLIRPMQTLTFLVECYQSNF